MYNKDGYDKDGYNRGSYDSEGFNRMVMIWKGMTLIGMIKKVIIEQDMI